MSDQTTDDLQERIKEQVNKQLAELSVEKVVAEQIENMNVNQLIANEVHAFFYEDQTDLEFERLQETDSWGRRKEGRTYILSARLSPFRYMVWNEVRKQIDMELQSFFQGDAWNCYINSEWDNNQIEHKKVEMGESLQKMLEEMTIKIASSMFSGMFAKCFEDVKYNWQEEVKRQIASDISNKML